VKEVPASKAYRFLEAGPVVLVSTVQEGCFNLMTMGFHMVMQHDPPLLGCIIGPWDYSYKALKATGECVIAVPGVDLAKKTVDIGNCTGADVDKFRKFRLTAMPAKKISAPLVKECLVNLECKVADRVEAYNLFTLEVVAIWTNPDRKEQRTFHHRGDGTFTVDGRILNLQERMVLWKQFQD